MEDSRFTDSYNAPESNSLDANNSVPTSETLRQLLQEVNGVVSNESNIPTNVDQKNDLQEQNRALVLQLEAEVQFKNQLNWQLQNMVSFTYFFRLLGAKM